MPVSVARITTLKTLNFKNLNFKILKIFKKQQKCLSFRRKVEAETQSRYATDLIRVPLMAVLQWV